MTKQHFKDGEQVRFRINGRPSRSARYLGVIEIAGNDRSLVTFPAPKGSGCDQERSWCDNTDLARAPGKVRGCEPPQADKEAGA